jgi:hypothetical protein
MLANDLRFCNSAAVIANAELAENKITNVTITKLIDFAFAFITQSSLSAFKSIFNNNKNLNI